ncbi:MAG: M48 family metallopeptidase, partial [Thermoguttaceae bacterium]|nr:M48 family metallopeptidase [Thermoguttaceae bacterium]
VSSLRERRLYNVVEEIALASGCPIPRVYIMRGEQSINACAIGTSPENAAVCVTAGAMDYLTRDELQGVIAHEFSHIVNNDVNINTKIIGYLFGLELIALIAAIIFRTALQVPFRVQTSRSDSENKDSGGGLTILLAILLFSGALFLIGYVGTVFGNLIRAAISRQREYLADASAVQFTRNPNGIAGALKKIGCPNLGSHIANSASVEASHLFFGSVFKTGFLQSLFQTHPPLVQRIRAIDPDFDGIFPSRVEKNVWASLSEESGDTVVPESLTKIKNAVENAAYSQFTGDIGQSVETNVAANVSAPETSGSMGFTREELYGSAFEDVIKPSDSPNGGQVVVESAILESVPAIWERFLEDSLSARATLYAVLRGNGTDEARRQRDIVERSEGFLLKEKLDFAWKAVEPLGDATRLILARKAIPLLKTMSLDEYRVFAKRL